MPHSSGGGSHGGGHHSRSHHHSSSHRSSSSGSSRSSTPSRRVRSFPFEGSTTYVYYRKRKPQYVYANYDIAVSRSNLGVRIFLAMFFLSVAVAVTVGLTFLFGHFPKKIDTANYNSDIVIEDNLGVIDDEESLRSSLEHFQDVTGITPAVLTASNDVWKDYYKSLEDYAYDEYVNRFKDEKHWLIVYTSATKDDGFEDWYWEGMQGDDTDSILGYKETEIFNSIFHKFLLQDNKYSVGEAMTAAFDELTPKAMKKPIGGAGVAVLIIFNLFYVGLALLMLDFSPKRDIYYPKAKAVQSEIVREEQCDYCNGVYVIGMDTKCPHCKAPVKPHDFVKDESGKIIKILN